MVISFWSFYSLQQIIGLRDKMIQVALNAPLSSEDIQMKFDAEFTT